MLILKDSIETACEAPSLTTGEEVLVANSKLATKIQPTEMQVHCPLMHFSLLVQ